ASQEQRSSPTRRSSDLDPSTQNRCTIAGMIGNNACGPHAVAYGRTADNTAALDVVDGTGRRFTAGRGDLAAVPGLEELVAGNLRPEEHTSELQSREKLV